MDADTEKDSTITTPTPMQRQESSSQGGRLLLVLLTSDVNFIHLAGVLKLFVKGGFEFRNTRNGTRVVTNDITKILSPWSRVLLEKLIVNQLVKKFYTFYRSPKVPYCIHKSSPLIPILSLSNPVHNFPPHFLNIQDFHKGSKHFQNPQLIEESEDFIFQQDGASPHFHRAVRAHLNEHLPNRWIGRAGQADSFDELAPKITGSNIL
jgi:hypothetical protein